jgi:hypothetical protein
MATLLKHFEVATDRVPRASARIWAYVDYGDTGENAVIRDLSPSGFGIETTRDLPEDARLAITIGAAPGLAATVVHKTQGRYGCLLDTPLTDAELDALTRDGPFASARPAPPAAAPSPTAEEPRLPLPIRVASVLAAATLCWSVVVAIGIALVG